LRRGYRTPDPSPSRDAARLPGCTINLFITAGEEKEDARTRGRARVVALSRTPSPSPMARYGQNASSNDGWDSQKNVCDTSELTLEKPFKQKLQVKLDELALPDGNLNEISTPRERARANYSVWADEVPETTLCQDNLSQMPQIQMQDMSPKREPDCIVTPNPSWRGSQGPTVLPLSSCIVYTQQQQHRQQQQQKQLQMQQRLSYQQVPQVPVQLELAKTCMPTPSPKTVPPPPVPQSNKPWNRDRTNSSRNLQTLVSKGSIGHPHQCASACKYAWKKRGCKDGINCDRCHLCEWKRHSGHAS